MQLSATSSSSSPTSSTNRTREFSVSGERVDPQRSKQNYCFELIKAKRAIFKEIAHRITSRPYRNVDFEISTVQLCAIQECLVYFDSIDDSILLEKRKQLNLFWLEILDMTIATLESIPQCLERVFVRDMRYTVAGLLDEGFWEDDNLEYRLVYDLNFGNGLNSAVASAMT